MDNNFYKQNRAKEIQREISQELRNRHLLKGVQREPLTGREARKLVLRLAPTLIVLTLWLLLALLA